MPKVQPSAGPGRVRGRRIATSLGEINVVPLVDVMLVLLIIFMVTAPMIQRGVDVNLPISRRAGAVEGERVFVTVPASYRQNMETLTDKQVYLRGDGSVQYQDLMDVFDRLKEAGVEKVGLVAKAPGEI
jgi:biopolymer transport protein TolR